MPHVEIYTDGGCEPNPGPGGYAAVLVHPKKRAETSGGFRLTTNNRMEILAAIKGLQMLKQPCKVTLYSDSQYLVDAIMRVGPWPGRRGIGGAATRSAPPTRTFGKHCSRCAKRTRWNSAGSGATPVMPRMSGAISSQGLLSASPTSPRTKATKTSPRTKAAALA